MRASRRVTVTISFGVMAACLAAAPARSDITEYPPSPSATPLARAMETNRGLVRHARVLGASAALENGDARRHRRVPPERRGHAGAVDVGGRSAFPTGKGVVATGVYEIAYWVGGQPQYRWQYVNVGTTGAVAAGGAKPTSSLRDLNAGVSAH
jgi:hypothetical protein